MPVPTQVGWLLVLALVVSAVGFYRTVYFVSLGYGFSIAGMGVASLAMFRPGWAWFSVAQAGLLVAHGLRLGVYLVRREVVPAYRRVQEQSGRPPRQPLGVSLAIWLSVSVLYVLMFSPALFALADGAGWAASPPAWPATVAVIGGLLVMAAGLAIETVADRQKARLKSREPDRFASSGLYAVVRCPNYLGEVLFWVGSFVAGLPFLTGWLRWVMALVGLVCIVLIMIGSTKRLELSQEQRYGARADFQDYVRTVPVLVPFVPLYTLRHVRVYLE